MKIFDVPIFYADKNKKFKKYIAVSLVDNIIWGSNLTDDFKKADNFSAIEGDTFEFFYNKIKENFKKIANGEDILNVKFRCIPYYLGLKFKDEYYICLKMNPFKYKLAKIKEFIRITPELIKGPIT